jgi:hypothetical protein
MLGRIAAWLGFGGGGDGQPALNARRDMKRFYPVLRDYDPREAADDFFAQAVVHRPICDGLAVYACRRIPIGEGGPGVDYVMQAELDAYGMSAEEVLDRCYENFFGWDIDVEVVEEDGARLHELKCGHDLVAAILGHESAYARFKEMTGSNSIAVLVLSPGALAVTSAGSFFDERFSAMAEELRAFEGAIELTPAVYYWTAEGELVNAEVWGRRCAD